MSVVFLTVIIGLGGVIEHSLELRLEVKSNERGKSNNHAINNTVVVQ